MADYEPIEVNEKQLEDLVRTSAGQIEAGLKYVDHQRKAGSGRLDVLLVDSGGALIVAELKVVEDDSMLVQGIDYYDYVSNNIAWISNAYKAHNINPSQGARLYLIAPSFPIVLINRCKWIDIPIRLFAYKCIKLKNGDIIPVFNEVNIPAVTEVPIKTTMEEHLNYITEPSVKALAEKIIPEIQSWDKDKILIEPVKYDISMKVSGHVFAYLTPRRKFFLIWTYDPDGDWRSFKVEKEENLEAVMTAVRYNMEEGR